MTTKKLYTEEELKSAFPEVSPGFQPFGSRVLIQIRTPKTRTVSGLIFTAEIQEIEKWNTQVGKVVALGPYAFCNRDTLKPWTEGAWAKVGGFVRIPRFNMDKQEIMADCGEKDVLGNPILTSVLFMTVNDLDLIGSYEKPLEVKAYV